MFGRKIPKYSKEKEDKLRDDIEDIGGLEKDDTKAMIIAALITILPICVGVLLVTVLIAMLLLGMF